MSDCGAKTRAGTPCKQAKGARTDHPGKGRCWLHGGRTPIRNPAAVDTTPLARYRAQNQPELAALIAEFEKDPDPLNVMTELAVLRAMVQRMLDRMEGVCGLCKRPPDEILIPGLIDQLSKVVDRVERARAARSISVEELVLLLRRFALVVTSNVRDQGTLEAISLGWEELRVSVTSNRGGKLQ